MHPEDIPLFGERIAQARGGPMGLDYEVRLRMPDGSLKYLRATANGTRAREGHLKYVGAVQDVTERRLSDEALANVRSELAYMTRVASMGALTASIAHEVNQPLSGIITNASTCLRMRAADPPNIEGALETARRTIRDGNRASEVISRLRALFAKKSTGTVPVDLNEATREVVALSVNELQRNRGSLRTEFASDLPLITGDRKPRFRFRSRARWRAQAIRKTAACNELRVRLSATRHGRCWRGRRRRGSAREPWLARAGETRSLRRPGYRTSS